MLSKSLFLEKILSTRSLLINCNAYKDNGGLILFILAQSIKFTASLKAHNTCLEAGVTVMDLPHCECTHSSELVMRDSHWYLLHVNFISWWQYTNISVSVWTLTTFLSKETCLEQKFPGDIQGKLSPARNVLVITSRRRNVLIRMQDYRPLCAVFMICATLVNTQTDRETDRELWLAILLALAAKLTKLMLK